MNHCHVPGIYTKSLYIWFYLTVTETQWGRYQYYLGKLNSLSVVCHKPILLIILQKSKPTEETLKSVSREYCHPELYMSFLFVPLHAGLELFPQWTWAWLCSFTNLINLLIHLLTSIYSVPDTMLSACTYIKTSTKIMLSLTIKIIERLYNIVK